MKTLTFKQQFLISALIQQIIDNSDKKSECSMYYTNTEICFSDEQKEAMVKFLNGFTERYNNALK